MRKQESQESQGAAMEVDREGPEPMDLSYIQKVCEEAGWTVTRSRKTMRDEKRRSREDQGGGQQVFTRPGHR